MKLSSEYRRIFGSGPSGVLVTVAVWVVAVVTTRQIDWLTFNLHPIVRNVLLVLFAADAFYLIGGSIIVLKSSERGKSVVTRGPYRFVRHPIYSAFIYSITGFVALWYQIWALVICVVPLALFWSWNVRSEEEMMVKTFGREYKKYIAETGQFLPSLKSLKKVEEHE